MRITVLVDNYVPNQFALRGEPSFCCHIEDEGLGMLFDLGMSALPFANARKLKVDLEGVDTIALSHGHMDHSWGLEYFERRVRTRKKPTFICHPEALEGKKYKRSRIGIKSDQTRLGERYRLIETRKPYRINERILFLGEIERSNDFENRKPLGKKDSGGAYVDDYLLDDSALALETDEGLVILTGCSHSGICNIIDHAKKVTGTGRIRAVIGGLHLQNDEVDEVTEKTLEYVERQGIGTFYPCHCTNLFNKLEIGKRVKVGEIGTGSRLEFQGR